MSYMAAKWRELRKSPGIVSPKTDSQINLPNLI